MHIQATWCIKAKGNQVRVSAHFPALLRLINIQFFDLELLGRLTGVARGVHFCASAFAWLKKCVLGHIDVKSQVKTSCLLAHSVLITLLKVWKYSKPSMFSLAQNWFKNLAVQSKVCYPKSYFMASRERWRCVKLSQFRAEKKEK